ncbi:two-component system, chemotaxis family, CheB/CheR fusion protein [Desulfonatronum thiosulfatophilum]|uniref:protein-glutamate O-methyltransferase n=1 Tax=Desulfonatronum thiosulfatophilum TaxID=617002 RepID=A0A1G6E3E1_9BACT|nr:chemotaxis protein CheB [Desulfonatronum thiosulfatophilum]SDB51964.1 two-component system, chemotaxis family, CheB/CheR fusion protein [Desulfonatronum thiosulfatophilum]
MTTENNDTESKNNPQPARPAKPDGAEVAESKGKSADSGFFIVGLGASAGGLAAFESFFSGMPKDRDPGMAFVLIQHLAADYKSMLSEIIQHHTRMPVQEARDGMVVQPNNVYTIPPNNDIFLQKGALRLEKQTTSRLRRMPIDHFFRSLAREQGERAIVIVLSGTGSDGAIGVREVKGVGGLTLAQEPETCDFAGMPESAIATDQVDYVLQPDKMPAQLMAYAEYARSKPGSPDSPSAKKNPMKFMLSLLHARSGHDFSQYKPSTIHRRIERRMALHHFTKPKDYIEFLEKDEHETEELFRDLLIGVTSFFRDPEAFQALEEKVIPRLFDKSSDSSEAIRVWCPGCSTGEEAYSLAILLAEQRAALNLNVTVQIFATDIDDRALTKARAGFFPANIAADISEQRLKNFFTRDVDRDGYRANKNIREMLIFSEQNVVRDPPFSRIDLISCRNLLIYMGGGLQKRLIPLFHYALTPDGYLFLGSSESVGDFGDLFTTLDRKWKLYQHKRDRFGARHPDLVHLLPSMTRKKKAFEHSAQKKEPDQKSPVRRLSEQMLLEHYGAAAALIRDHGDILYLHGRTGMYLEPEPGEAAVNNVLRMARLGLRTELSVALHKSAVKREIVRSYGVKVKTNGHMTVCNLTIYPVSASRREAIETGGPLFLIVLEQARSAFPEHSQHAHQFADPSLRADKSVAPDEETPDFEQMDASEQIASLQEEIRMKDNSLQSTLEELETSNEELQSTNEEMQSINEELQSTNEELETSKEELQSVNEELTTVNAQLQTYVTELTRANNDMNNLFAATGVGTLFVDTELHIVRFTPATTQVINLIKGDVGRPIGHIVTKLKNYDSLMEDIQGVLDSLGSKDIEVRNTDGDWYLIKIRPYRTQDNVIEGAVITFLDINSQKETRDKLREVERSETRYRLLSGAIVETSRAPMVVLDAEKKVVLTNLAFLRMFQVSEANTKGLMLSELGNMQWDIPELQGLLDKVLREDQTFNDFMVTHEFETIGKRTMLLNGRILRESGLDYILLSIEDVTGKDG